MYNAVLAVLKSPKYNSLWSSKVGLSKAVTDLQAAVQKISDCSQVQETRDGATEEKAQSLQDLVDKAFEVAAATKSYASNTGDKYLAGQVDFSRTDITKGRDATVSARCRGIHTAANGVLAALADYDVTSGDLDLLDTRIGAFDAVQTKPRQATAAGNAATRQLPTLFTKASGILNDRLDGLLAKFEATQPAFVSEYQAARSIVDPGNRSSKIVPAPNTTAQSKAA